MSNVVIHVEELGKRYRIGQQQNNRTLRDALVDKAASVPRRLLRNGRQGVADNSIWALRDVSFEVKQGEVLGIIGRNGAGKSTLLKILSRITKPTTGCVKIRGRVGSLLEVGTGFHPELTGRENIYLNGAILGMRKVEIDRKFDEVVAFAEIERFLDTPVKRYSSGMYVRLAFAVAAHLEPEILVVDEVLAVGDAAFQKKCLGKMSDVASGGRTVLFVSHNMNAVQRLCSHAVLLEQGQLVAAGQTEDVVNLYLANSVSHSPNTWIDVSHLNRRGTGQARVSTLRFSSCDKAYDFHLYPGGPLEITMHMCSDTNRTLDSLAAIIYDRYGTKLINADTISIGQSVTLSQGENVVRLRIEALHLNPGVYQMGWWLGDAFGRIFDFAESAIDLEVMERETAGLGVRPRANGVVNCQFSVIEVS